MQIYIYQISRGKVGEGRNREAEGAPGLERGNGKGVISADAISSPRVREVHERPLRSVTSGSVVETNTLVLVMGSRMGLGPGGGRSATGKSRCDTGRQGKKDRTWEGGTGQDIQGSLSATLGRKGKAVSVAGASLQGLSMSTVLRGAAQAPGSQRSLRSSRGVSTP